MSAVRGTAPRIGCIAVAVPLLILAGWAAFEGWHQPDQDDRNEYYAVVLFARGALKPRCGARTEAGLHSMADVLGIGGFLAANSRTDAVC